MGFTYFSRVSTGPDSSVDEAVTVSTLSSTSPMGRSGIDRGPHCATSILTQVYNFSTVCKIGECEVLHMAYPRDSGKASLTGEKALFHQAGCQPPRSVHSLKREGNGFGPWTMGGRTLSVIKPKQGLRLDPGNSNGYWSVAL